MGTIITPVLQMRKLRQETEIVELRFLPKSSGVWVKLFSTMHFFFFFGCAGSSLLLGLFSSCGELGPL